MSAHRNGVLWIVTSAVSYSLFAVFSKSVLDDLRPTDVLFWRFVIAVPVIWTAVAVRRRRTGIGPRSAPIRPFTIAGVVFGVLALFAFLGLDHLSAALYTVIIYTYPAMVAIGSALLGRRPPRRVWLAVGVTLVGIALTVPQVFSDAQADGFGLVLTLLNALLYAGYILGTAKFVTPAATDAASGTEPAVRPDGLVASAWSCVGSLVFAVGVIAVVGVRLPPDAGAWAGLVGLAVVSTVIAATTFFLGLALLPPATAALVATLEPVLTLLWAMTILGEHLVPVQVAGAVLVLGGVVWSQRTNPVAAAEPG